MKLEAIRALIEAATPGPWTCDFDRDRAEVGKSRTTMSVSLGNSLGRQLAIHQPSSEQEASFKFVAASRTLLPRLLAVAEAVKALGHPQDHQCHGTGCERCALNAALTALEAE